MNPLKNYILTPGPTPIPQEVLRALGGPIIHHRTPQFQEILKRVTQNLKYVFKTENDVVILSSSGTGAMEAAVANLLSRGERALVVRGGKFGERWGQICQAYGIEALNLDVEWGEAVLPAQIEEILVRENASPRPLKAVFVTLCETSTGVKNDIQAIGEIVGRFDTVLVVDAISGLCSDDLQVDGWRVDIAVSGSQKGLMLPPGLAFCSISQKAWKLINESNSPRFYFDLRSAKKAAHKSDTPFTTAINLIMGLDESLGIIRQEGIDNIIARCARLAKATRSALEALGLKLLSRKSPSNAVTAAIVPEGVDGANLVRFMRDELGVTIAGGQGKLKGKIFRIAHMGYIDGSDLIVGLWALEMALKKMGYKFKLGSGLTRLEERLCEY
jgi:aspartate aminotransferase-like enzyme